jgi:transposase
VLGFPDLKTYLQARYVDQGWPLARVRAELGVGKAWLRAQVCFVLGFVEAPSLGRQDGVMADHNNPHSSQRRYPPQLRERAVRMVVATIEQTGERVGVTRVARQLGIGSESLRSWVRQAEVDGGQRPGVTTTAQQRTAELEREVRELRRANEILRTASAFFAAELDGRRPR